MKDIQVMDANEGNIGGCSLCGNKNPWNVGFCRKRDWLIDRFSEGLKYKILCSEEFGDIGMIEYTEGRYAWRPVEAEGYMFIHCLMVLARHQKKGLGNLLLESCVRDAKQGKYHGVAVVTSTDSFMARSDVFLKGGFVPVDRITPYELLVKKFGKNAANPRFLVEKGRLVERYGRGLTILAADQCPYVVKSVERIAAACKKLGIEPNVVRVESAEASRMLPTPYGVFCILHDGSVIAKRPISGTRFLSIMGGVVGKR